MVQVAEFRTIRDLTHHEVCAELRLKANDVGRLSRLAEGTFTSFLVVALLTLGIGCLLRSAKQNQSLKDDPLGCFFFLVSDFMYLHSACFLQLALACGCGMLLLKSSLNDSNSCRLFLIEFR